MIVAKYVLIDTFRFLDWSDFNAEDERSWQLGYGLDFTTFGVPGLTYNFAYVCGDNITTSTSEGGTEREIFNQFKYVVQSGPATSGLEIQNARCGASGVLRLKQV